MTNYQHIAEQMYAAYCQQAGGLTFDGKPLPSFQELGLERQTCWKAVAEAMHSWKAAAEAAHKQYAQPQADAETLAQAYERGRRHGFHNRVAAYMEAKEQFTIADALDAERYRWLRNCDVETRDNGDVFVGCAKGKIVLNGADLDAVVGAAITAAKENK